MTELITNEELYKKIKGILENVTDPEIPVLTISDLGILRDVKLKNDEVEVIITPTYTGCPAMDMIAANIRMALLENGFKKIKPLKISAANAFINCNSSFLTQASSPGSPYTF